MIEIAGKMPRISKVVAGAISLAALNGCSAGESSHQPEAVLSSEVFVSNAPSDETEPRMYHCNRFNFIVGPHNNAVVEDLTGNPTYFFDLDPTTNRDVRARHDMPGETVFTYIPPSGDILREDYLTGEYLKAVAMISQVGDVALRGEVCAPVYGSGTSSSL